MRQAMQAGGKRAAVVSAAAHALLLALLLSAGSGQGPPPVSPSIIEAELSDFAAPPDDAEIGTAEAPPPAPEPTAAAPSEPPPATAVAAEPTPRAPAEPAATDAPPIPTETPALVAAPADNAAEDTTTATAAAPSLLPGEPLANAQQQMLTKRLESWTGRFTPEEPEPTLTWRDNGQRYTAVLRRQPAPDAMGMEHLTVEVTTERDGNRMLTELRMMRLAFSSFAQFVDRWDPDVSIHDDDIEGRFHSNSEITVSGGRVRPVFHGKVTLAARDFETERERVGKTPPSVNRRKMFPGGIETMVRRIALAPRLPPGAPDAQLQRFENDAAITFYEDGSYGWRALDGTEPEQRRRLTEQPHYLLGANDDVTLRVQGTVNGTVLVYTPGRIVVSGNLRYAHDPRSPGSGDLLGLVAERSVEIGEPDLTGPGDLDVYASIYARGLFSVRQYLSDPAGTLLVYGSIAVGSMTASEPRFATKVVFDTRLTLMRPPGFPLSDRYELDSSSGEWRRAPAASR